MNTLEHHKRRLEAEISSALESIRQIRASDCPDLKALNQLNDAVERNRQVIGMINNHLGCGHQPMWREK